MASRFEDLRVWQAAKKQCEAVGELIERPEFQRSRKLSEHIDGSSVSVMNNISEGFLRHRDKEFAQFLRIAAGSNGEVRTCLYAAYGRRYLSKEEADRLIEESNAIGRMIRRLSDSLNP